MHRNLNKHSRFGQNMSKLQSTKPLLWSTNVTQSRNLYPPCIPLIVVDAIFKKIKTQQKHAIKSDRHGGYMPPTEILSLRIESQTG